MDYAYYGTVELSLSELVGTRGCSDNWKNRSSVKCVLTLRLPPAKVPSLQSFDACQSTSQINRGYFCELCQHSSFFGGCV